MSKKLLVGLLSVLLAGFMIYGCGKVSDDKGEVIPEGMGRITGQVYAADGVTPIAGARVWTTGSVYETNTNTDGSYQLDAPPGQKVVYVEKGPFSAEFNALFEEGKSTAVDDTSLDPDDPNVEGNLAVVTGSFDRMEDVLAKLGLGTVDSTGMLILGTEKFDLYYGGGFPFLSPPSYETFATLITSPETMNQYDVIFINCGNSDEDLLFSDPAVINNIRNYVSAGGSLYVTDLSYDFVEQVFPEYIDFYGSDTTPASSPEGWDDAEVGDDGIEVDAEVLDATLEAWLDDRGALNPDGTVHIAGFASGWAVINEAASGTKVWVRGNVTYSGLGVTGKTTRGMHSQSTAPKVFGAGVKPLTVSFDYGDNGGKVLYTSYHTEHLPDPSLRPQEYILAYLVFEM